MEAATKGSETPRDALGGRMPPHGVSDTGGLREAADRVTKVSDAPRNALGGRTSPHGVSDTWGCAEASEAWAAPLAWRRRAGRRLVTPPVRHTGSPAPGPARPFP